MTQNPHITVTPRNPDEAENAAWLEVVLNDTDYGRKLIAQAMGHTDNVVGECLDKLAMGVTND